MTSPSTSTIPHLALASGADPIIRKKEAAAVAGFSVSTLDRMLNGKNFPAPVELSPGRIGWRLSEVKGWVESRPAARRRARRMKGATNRIDQPRAPLPPAAE